MSNCRGMIALFSYALVQSSSAKDEVGTKDQFRLSPRVSAPAPSPERISLRLTSEEAELFGEYANLIDEVPVDIEAGEIVPLVSEAELLASQIDEVVTVVEITTPTPTPTPTPALVEKELLPSRGGGATAVQCPDGSQWSGFGEYCLLDNLYTCRFPGESPPQMVLVLALATRGTDRGGATILPRLRFLRRAPRAAAVMSVLRPPDATGTPTPSRERACLKASVNTRIP
jgi:hypothetical protein